MEHQWKNSWVPAFLLFVTKVKIPSKELIEPGPITLYEAQLRFLREVDEGLSQGQHLFVILKARQLGLSTIGLLLDVFWLYMFPGLQGALIADTESNREIFRSTISQMLDSLPPGFRIRVSKHNRNSLVLANGSRLQYLSAGKGKNPDLGRSRGLNFIHATELSSWGDQDGINSLLDSLATENPNRLYIFESPLALDTPIPTPTGWSTMGEIKEGDHVFNEDGKPCRVEGTSPVFTDRKCFRVTFDNGDSIVADDDHQWRIIERRWPTNPQWRVRDLPTRALDPKKHVIYVTKPLALPEPELPLDPYLLGAWLGDGDSAGSRITCSEEDLEDMTAMVAACGYQIGAITRSKDRAPSFGILGIRRKFFEMGLIRNKHIPAAYLRASEDQRRALLAGLMDTDGYINRNGFGCNFSSTNMRLLADVSELLSSLGIKHVESLNAAAGKIRLFPQGHLSVCQESRRLQFSELWDRKVFRLKRKREIHETPRDQVWRKIKRLRIVSLEEVASVPVRCISVDTPSHLFLAGKTMVPTHNTAKGYNVFHDIYRDAKVSATQRAVFIGWWAKEPYTIQRTLKTLNGEEIPNPEFARWWETSPILSDQEHAMSDLIYEDYGMRLTPEQWAWWRERSFSRSEQNLLQEMPWHERVAFQVTGSSFFNQTRLADDIRFIRDNGLAFDGYRYTLGDSFLTMRCDQVYDSASADLRVWEAPVRNARYVIGMDVAYGRSDTNDRHVVSCWRCYADKLVQVAEWATSRPETNQAAWVLAHLAGSYRDCMINLEISGPGQQIMQEMKYLRQQIQTAHLIDLEPTAFSKNALDLARWFLYNRPDSPSQGYVWAWRTNLDNKLEMFNGYRDSYSTEQVVIRSMPLLQEMVTLVQNGTSIAGSGRNKDDRPFAAGLACHAWKQWVRFPMMAENRTFAIESQKQRDMMLGGHNVVTNLIPAFFQQRERDRREAELQRFLEG